MPDQPGIPPATDYRLPLDWARTWLAPLPQHRRVPAAVVLLICLHVIGWLDYRAGFWVSFQLFYLGPIVLAVAWFGWRAGCVAAALSVVLRFLGDAAAGIFDHVGPGPVFWNRLAEIATSFILVFAVHALFLLQRELEERIRQRTASLEQAVAARNELQRALFETSRRERSAIGHDLHDGLGQHLTATSMAANLLASRLTAAGQPTAADAHVIVRLIQDAIDKTRQIARGLLLSAIEPDSLLPELEELSENIRAEHGVMGHFSIRGSLRGLDVVASSQIFYIAQEAALNAVRHAHATQIEIDLSIDERALVLSVSDDGIGLDHAPESAPGMGLRIMRHRSELIGAAFSLERPAAGGTRVRCELPLSPDLAPSP